MADGVTWPLATGNTWTYDVHSSTFVYDVGQPDNYDYVRTDSVIGEAAFHGRQYRILHTGGPIEPRHWHFTQSGATLLSFSPIDTLEAYSERAELVSSLPWPIFDLTRANGDSQGFFALDTSGVHFRYEARFFGDEVLELGGCEVQVKHVRYLMSREYPMDQSRVLTIDYYIRDEVGVVKEVGVDEIGAPAGLSHRVGWVATLRSYQLKDAS